MKVVGKHTREQTIASDWKSKMVKHIKTEHNDQIASLLLFSKDWNIFFAKSNLMVVEESAKVDNKKKEIVLTEMVQNMFIDIGRRVPFVNVYKLVVPIDASLKQCNAI